MRVGVLSDTHGRLPSTVHEALAGVERIIHAGDVGAAHVLHELEAIAPVTAVSGNVDAFRLGGILDPLANIALAGTRVLVVHRREDVPRSLPSGVGVVVFGHTHVPVAEERDGVLWLNPGSPTRARSGSRHSVAILEIEDETATATIVAI